GAEAAEAATLESAGELAAALRVADNIVRRMPLEEFGHRRLIRLHYLRGDRAAGLAAYEQCVERLRRELDIAPSEETRLLAVSLEAGPAPVPRPARAAVPVTLSRPPRLIGREHELEALDHVWRERPAFLVVGHPRLRQTPPLAEISADTSPAPLPPP